MTFGSCLNDNNPDYVHPEQSYQPDFPKGANQPIDGPIGSSNTKLDAIQTTLPPPMKQTFKSMMGLDTSAEYVTALNAYERIESDAKTTPYERIKDCCSRSWFYRHEETGRVRVGASRCNLRWCPICAGIRKRAIAEPLEKWLSGLKFKKFITLTLKNSAAPLAGQIDLLYTYFTYLRKKKLWKESVKGGVWFFQVTYNHNDGEWHPHIHIAADSTFLDKWELSALWLEITKNSMIVDVDNIDSDERAAEYVAKYGAKPAFLKDLGVDNSIEAITAMHGRRILGKFGTAKDLSFKPEPPADAKSWVKVGSWFTIRQWFDKSEVARCIYTAWRSDTAISADMTLYGDADPEPPPDELPILSTYKQLQFDFQDGLSDKNYGMLE